jgi:hypothetical protein
VQNAYFMGSIGAEKVMNLKSSQRFRDLMCANNTGYGALVPRV